MLIDTRRPVFIVVCLAVVVELFDERNGARTLAATVNDSKRCVVTIARKNNIRHRTMASGQLVNSERTTKPFQFCSYLGIPYARPPVGKLRFEPPQLTPASWTGTKHFTKVANICLQLAYSSTAAHFVGNENCLYLNVHTRQILAPPTPPLWATSTTTSPPAHTKRNTNKPNKPHKRWATPTSATAQQYQHQYHHHPYRNRSITSSSMLMPVILWIHGGSFNLGSANSDTNGPDYLVEKNVVVVTINYRLGPLGFLRIPAANISGNYGLQDQQMAMKWTQRYIKYFGGDPRRVTLMGWSAGAASVSYHLYASSSRHLFHRAILMSGSMLNPWAFNGNNTRCTSNLLRKLKVIDAMTAPTLKGRLQTIKSSQFVQSAYFFVFFGSPEHCFVPSLDSDFATESPERMVALRRPINAVRLLVGATSIEFESDYPYDFVMQNVALPNANRTIPHLVNSYMQRYFKLNGDDHGGDELDEAGRDRFVRRLRSIADIYYGLRRFVQRYVNVTGEKVFGYRFLFDGKFGHFKKQLRTDTAGAVHGDDLGYLFGALWRRNGDVDDGYGDRWAVTSSKDVDDDDDDVAIDVKNGATPQYKQMDFKNEILISSRMVEMWTNFIKFGDPTPNTSELLYVKWPAYNDEHRLLHINTSMSLEQDLIHLDADYQLWDAIHKCLYNNHCVTLRDYLIGNKTIF